MPNRLLPNIANAFPEGVDPEFWHVQLGPCCYGVGLIGLARFQDLWACTLSVWTALGVEGRFCI